MATITLSLPDQMQEWVEAQIKSGRYSSSSDYISDLIRKDQERMGKIAKLQGFITEGLESGESGPYVPDPCG